MIRLRRAGSKGRPTYRIVVADRRSPRDGRFIETVGTYDPRPNPSVIDVDTERVQHWIDRGAQPSEAVAKLTRSV